MNFDAIIVGGGPAGSTLAGMLLKYRPESRVLVLERATCITPSAVVQ